MKNKLTKKERSELQKEMDNDFVILKKVNVVNPAKEDKDAYYELLKRKPDMFEYMTTLTEETRHFILSQHCSFLAVEGEKYKLKKMRGSLGWETASELERLLIEQICINYLRVTLLEKTHAHKINEKHDTETGLYWEKRLDSAHRRYMRTLETLAKVRKYLAEAEFREGQAQRIREKAAKIVGAKT